MSARHIAEVSVRDSQQGYRRIHVPNLGHPRAHGHRAWQRLWPRALEAVNVRQNPLRGTVLSWSIPSLHHLVVLRCQS
jgi:hypothetical protein